jgi:hypothetical protein
MVSMLTKDALKFFGSPAVINRLLNLSRTAAHQWGDVVPMGSAYRLQELSNGKLRVDPDLYQHGRPRKGIDVQQSA